MNDEQHNQIIENRNREIRELKKGLDTLNRKWEKAIKERDDAERLLRHTTNEQLKLMKENDELKATLASLGKTYTKS